MRTSAGEEGGTLALALASPVKIEPALRRVEEAPGHRCGCYGGGLAIPPPPLVANRRTRGCIGGGGSASMVESKWGGRMDGIEFVRYNR